MSKTVAKTVQRWTPEQVDALMTAVREEKTAQAAFERVASELGKSKGTVQQKYYAVKKKTTPARKRAASVKASAPLAPRAVSNGHSNLADMSMGEFAALAEAVHAEAQRRRADIERVAGLFA